MATKTEIKSLLKELNYTENEMDKFWEDNIETNWKVKNLNDNGKTWRDLHISVIKHLPTQKQKDLELAEKKRMEEEIKAKEEAKRLADKKYYNEHFEEIITDKIDKKENLTEKELQTLVWQYESETENGENRRWTRTNTTIIKLLDRYFSIDWEEGLTESQPNEFYNQPYEVELEESEKVVVVRNWVRMQ